MGNSFSNNTTKRQNSDLNAVLFPPPPRVVSEEEKLREQQKYEKEQQKLEKELQERQEYEKKQQKLEKMTVMITDKLIQYKLLHPENKVAKAELPINYIMPQYSKKSILVKTHLLLYEKEYNLYEFFFSIENQKDSKILFTKLLYEKKYLNPPYYIIKDMVQTALSNIQYILYKIKIDTYNECFTEHYAVDEEYITDNFFKTDRIDTMQYNKCNICGEYTKNQEICYFCE